MNDVANVHMFLNTAYSSHRLNELHVEKNTTLTRWYFVVILASCTRCNISNLWERGTLCVHWDSILKYGGLRDAKDALGW